MSSKPMMYFAGGCALLIALGLALLGLTFLIGSQGKAGTAMTGLLMLVIGIGSGVFAIRKLGQVMATTPDRIDERVLNLATMSGGDLTTGEVAGALSIPVQEAEASLGRLVGRGMATVKTRPDGQVSYAISGLAEARKVKKCPYCGNEYGIADPKRTCPSCGANLQIVDADL
jgi:hypothetical protein